MAKLALKVASTSRLVRIFIQDSSQTDGRGLTGLVFGSPGLTAYYIKDGQASATQITLITMTVGTWVSGGFKEVDATNLPGIYELGLPDAAISTGKNVLVMLKGGTNMVVVPLEIELEAVDNQDTVRYGLTALPNVAAGANGGLPTGNASGQVAVGSTASGAITSSSFASGAIDAAAIATDAIGSAELAATAVSKIQTSVTAGAVASVTGAVGSVAGNVTGSVGSIATGGITAASFAADAITAAKVAADVGTEIAAAVWDRLTSALTTVGSIGKLLVDNGTPPSAATVAAAVWDRLTSALTTSGSIGKLLVDNIDTTISSRLATVGYTAPPSLATIVAGVWDRLTSALTTSGSIGKLLVDNLDVVLSTRSSASALTTAQTAITDLQSRTPAALVGGRTDASVGAMAADVITASALSTAAVDEILDDTIGDDTITVRQALRVLIAGMAGKLSGAATTTVTIRNLADSADVIVATVDADGNRSAVTVTP